MEGNYRKYEKQFLKSLKTFLLLCHFKIQLSILRTSYLYLEVQHLVPLWVRILLDDLSAQLERQKDDTSVTQQCFIQHAYD